MSKNWDLLTWNNTLVLGSNDDIDILTLPFIIQFFKENSNAEFIQCIIALLIATVNLLAVRETCMNTVVSGSVWSITNFMAIVSTYI